MTVRVRGPPLYPLNKNNNDINQNTNYKVKYGTKNHNTNINSHYQINNELKSYGHFGNQIIKVILTTKRAISITIIGMVVLNL